MTTVAGTLTGALTSTLIGALIACYRHITGISPAYYRRIIVTSTGACAGVASLASSL
jgi:hypothetical protein